MAPLTRRELILAAAAMGATWACAGSRALRSRSPWIERRDRFAEGVASGDPGPDSVLLWTRASDRGTEPAVPLTVEVAEDPGFERVVATAPTRALLEADHTCRVLVGGLRPGRTYWYRFIDEKGDGSRIGRTRTAPADDDPRPVRFAFVSCQNICEGAQNAYRRMIFEDERAAPEDQLAFVLHLGDFVYEVVDYPEEVPGGHRYDRRLRDAVRFPDGEKVSGFWVPASLADYRVLYRAYLRDPDLQDARARLPFVAMWDNHEFSWMGWQSFQRFEGKARSAQAIKVAANQAWFEYQPARVSHAGGPSLERFDAPPVQNAPIQRFDEQGLGQEPNNLAAIGSLTAYRTLRWGRFLELLITDQHSYRSEVPDGREEARPLQSGDFPELVPLEMMQALDAGRAYADGRPPETIRYGEVQVPNFRKDEAPQTILGAEQKAWFLDRLRASRATWKVWGNSLGSLDWRADPQNLPAGLGTPWPGNGYACFGGGGDWSTAYTERGQIYDTVRDAGITGFLTVSGDRHEGPAARSLRAGRRRVHHRLHLRARPGGGLRAPIPPGPPAARPLYDRGRRQEAADGEPADASRRAGLPGVSAQRRCRAGAPRLEPGPGAAPFFPGHGRSRLCHAAPDGGRGRMRARLHSPAARAQRGPGRRPAPLSRRSSRADVERG